MTELKMFVDQIIGLSWVRCLIEQGVVFENRYTNKNEKDEKIIVRELRNPDSDAFVMPSANADPAIFEKNILETIGHYHIFNEDVKISEFLFSPSFLAFSNKS